MKASRPSLEFSSASAGFTGTGRFAAGPSDDAGEGSGLDEAEAEASAVADPTVGDAESDVPLAEGSASPWHPVTSINTTAAAAIAGALLRPPFARTEITQLPHYI
ncbi:hypothetical protein [Arthrobacter sp. B1805]|uniref:hypothetical protein n=1 Tax=Arthrobacter sp. B1805 TaxID=2058892 RepID=UPI0021572052|nr:hypothetical protein [Arthrobacter sp. B1805]